MTVSAIVNAVTANLPAVRRVQLLVDGKEVDTIAGPRGRETAARAGPIAAQGKVTSVSAHRPLG